MKISKRILLFLTVLLLTVGCKPSGESGGDGSSNVDSGTSSGQISITSDLVQYTITFNSVGGSSVSSVTVNTGTEINKPTDPTKPGYIFDGWYYESSYVTPVLWPLEVVSSLTLYARWMNNRDYFLAARNRTVESAFEYDFNLAVTTLIGSFDGPGAIIDGKTKYNANSSTTFLSQETRSGALIGDGQVTLVKVGTNLLTVKQNPEGKLSSFKEEEVDGDFKYETSSFAKALFEYDADDITSVIDLGAGRYQLNYSGSVTGFMTSAMSFLNHPLVDKIISLWIDLPSKDANLKTHVTFKDGFIKKYSYEFSVSVSVGTLTFSYDLDFVRVGSGVTIIAPNFPGYYLTQEQVNGRLNDVKDTLTQYRTRENSGYTYKLETAIKYPQSAFAINATLQGRTMRKIESGINYFWNRVKFDSDYKNNDLYGTTFFGDYERYRVKYANGLVYDVQDRTWPLSNIHTNLSNYNNEEIDGFYGLLPNSYFAFANINAIEEEIKGLESILSFSLSNVGVQALMTFVDQTIRTDLNSTNEFAIFNNPTDLTPNNIKFNLIIGRDGSIKFDIRIDGAFVNDYPSTIFNGAADFTIKLLLESNGSGDGYTAPTKDADVILSNT